LKSKTSKKESNQFIVIKKNAKSMILSDNHTIATGTTELLQKGIIDDFYHTTSFSFEMLKRAEMFFKAIHGNLYDENKLRCLVSDRQAPIIFIYESTTGKDEVFAIAPRTISGVKN